MIKLMMNEKIIEAQAWFVNKKIIHGKRGTAMLIAHQEELHTFAYTMNPSAIMR